MGLGVAMPIAMERAEGIHVARGLVVPETGRRPAKELLEDGAVETTTTSGM